MKQTSGRAIMVRMWSSTVLKLQEKLQLKHKHKHKHKQKKKLINDDVPFPHCGKHRLEEVCQTNSFRWFQMLPTDYIMERLLNIC
ncbi:Hypothetical predicted protein [Podarcis lilfordi]|nr:Hypothetical predicted protein [Podarcis lilfordi]